MFKIGFMKRMPAVRPRAALIVLLMLLAVIWMPVGHGEARSADMVLMIYMCGSDLEDQAGAATRDLEEMRSALPSDGALEIIVMAGGSPSWKTPGIDAETVGIYRLTPAGIEPAEAGKPASMSDPETLGRLLRYGHDCCPAKRYALLMWDHGAGPMMGLCFDARTDSGDGMESLSLPDLESALADSPFAGEKLAWIGLDACLMASAETARVLAPYAEYMIASQEPEPLDGWSYRFIAEMAGDASGAQTGRRIVDAYSEYYADSLADITLSCVDLSKMDAVSEGMSELFGSFTVDADSYMTYARNRSEARSIGGVVYPYDLVDLVDLLELYDETGVADCQALLLDLSEAIVYNRANCPFRNGLSLYYPMNNKARYASPWSSLSDEIGLSEGYRSFIRDSSAIWMGEALADWTLPDHIQVDHTRLNLELTDAQVEQFAKAQLIVMEEGAAGKYRQVYCTDEVELHGNCLSAVYSGEALFVVDDAGTIRSGAVGYYAKDGDIYAPVMLVVPQEVRKSELAGVYLRYRIDEDGVCRFVEIQEDSDNEVGGKTTLRMEDCIKFGFCSRVRIPVRDEQGRLLPYSDWIKTWPVVGEYVQGFIPDTLAFYPLNDGEQRWAHFEITDLQGNVTSSELFELPNEMRTRLPVKPQTLMDNQYCRMTVESVTAFGGPYPGLELVCTMENRTDRVLDCEISIDRIDDMLISCYGIGGSFVDDVGPGEKESFFISIYADLFRDARIRSLEEIELGMKLEDGESLEKLRTESAVVPFKFDTGLLLPDQPDDAPLDSAQWNDVEIRLLDARYGDYKRPETVLLFVNRGDRDVRVYWNDDGFELNGRQAPSPATEQFFDVPAGMRVLKNMTWSSGTLDGRSDIESMDFQIYTYKPSDIHLSVERDDSVRTRPAVGDGIEGSVPYPPNDGDLPNETRTRLPFKPQTLMDNRYCRMTLESVTAFGGQYPGLELACNMENRTDRALCCDISLDRVDDMLLSFHGLGGSFVVLDPGENKAFSLSLYADFFQDARIRSLEEIEFGMKLEDGESSDKLLTESAVVPFRFDAGLLIPDQPDDVPLASAQWNDVEIRLLDARYNDYSFPETVLLFVNRGDQDVRIYWNDDSFELNGLQILSPATEQFFDLPAGMRKLEEMMWLTQMPGGRPDIESVDFQIYTYELSDIHLSVTKGDRS